MLIEQNTHRPMLDQRRCDRPGVHVADDSQFDVFRLTRWYAGCVVQTRQLGSERNAGLTKIVRPNRQRQKQEAPVSSGMKLATNVTAQMLSTSNGKAFV